MNHILITEQRLNIPDMYNKVRDPSCGAISSFVGTTRDLFNDKPVVKLEYEAYIGMAEKALGDICKQLRSQWPLHHILMAHRLGSVPVGEESVAIFVSSVHRAESLAAVSAAIDALKASVPIWKKELYSDGSSNWKVNAECAWK
ncbi:unnamed protein product [Notodromas monacha]|uniref:Molybdopterin synthase catalytic subunit n=1 Tax=Notodromas monacha TaxID=399045 RepID=A0A7R9BRK5_9CRUS|nr:unnamed protein product [Notodromas monacha]CAG0919009.1 unnamed protein product [Notodromas monacha]